MFLLIIFIRWGFCSDYGGIGHFSDCFGGGIRPIGDSPFGYLGDGGLIGHFSGHFGDFIGPIGDSHFDHLSCSYGALVPRLARAVTWSRGPRPWRGVTHGPPNTATCPV